MVVLDFLSSLEAFVVISSHPDCLVTSMKSLLCLLSFRMWPKSGACGSWRSIKTPPSWLSRSPTFSSSAAGPSRRAATRRCCTARGRYVTGPAAGSVDGEGVIRYKLLLHCGTQTCDVGASAPVFTFFPPPKLFSVNPLQQRKAALCWYATFYSPVFRQVWAKSWKPDLVKTVNLKGLPKKNDVYLFQECIITTVRHKRRQQMPFWSRNDVTVTCQSCPCS